MSSSIVPLSILDDHSVRGQIQLPSHAVRQNEHLNGALRKELGDNVDFLDCASFVEVTNPITQGLRKSFIFDVTLEKSRELALVTMQESRSFVVRCRISQQIDRSELGLLSGWDVYDNRTCLIIVVKLCFMI